MSPSRIVWFAIGAGAATWFHCKYGHHMGGRNCVPAARHSNQNVYTVPPPPFDGQDRGYRPPISDSAPNYPYNPPHPSDQSRWPLKSFPESMEDRNWDERKAKLNELRKQAQETFSELSESTLDGVISTVEVLKAKLAEHRAEREAQVRKMEEERRLAEERNPGHIV